MVQKGEHSVLWGHADKSGLYGIWRWLVPPLNYAGINHHKAKNERNLVGKLQCVIAEDSYKTNGICD